MLLILVDSLNDHGIETRTLILINDKVLRVNSQNSYDQSKKIF